MRETRKHFFSYNKGARAKPASETAFPDASRQPTRPLVFPGDLPPVPNTPQQRNQDFHGRDELPAGPRDPLEENDLPRELLRLRRHDGRRRRHTRLQLRVGASRAPSPRPTLTGPRQLTTFWKEKSNETPLYNR